ncbi:ABC transporter substrate-binding protein [Paenibacillus lentus]|uniref:ABC transporter substrate-binding protein n=1 Tax=Paenibacillus lentus TaxID=1338368 RepID=UPI003654C67A
MKHHKKYASLLLALVLILSLTACGGNGKQDDNAGQSSDKAVLQYYTWTDEEDYMRKIVDDFNAKHENIEVKLNTISNDADEYNTKIMTNLSGGSQMDVYSINGTASLGMYAQKNQLLDLTEQIKNSKVEVSAYGPSFQDIVTVLTEGKYFALPYRTSQYAIFYNKAIFDKEGIEYPEQMTWNEYAELAKQLTKGEGVDKQWGGYYADWLIAPLGGLQSGSTILDDNLEPVEGFLQFLNRIYYEDQSHMSYKQMKGESIDWIKQFEVGNVAMLINGEWTINMLKADIDTGKTDIEFDMAPLPLPDGVQDQTTVGGVSTFIGINPASKNQEAAFEFVKYVTGNEGGTMIAESNVLPAFSSKDTKESYLKATNIQGSSYFFDAKTVMENQPVPKIDEVNRIFSEQRDLYLFQEQDLETTMNTFQQQRNQLLQQ